MRMSCAPAVIFALTVASSASAQDLRLDVTFLETDPDCKAEPTASKRTHAAIEWEVQQLRRDRREVRIAGSAIGVVFSIMGLTLGTWLLSYGMMQTVESTHTYEPSNSCYTESEWAGWCVSRAAPYGGTALMGLSGFTLGRSIKKLREKRNRRRHYARRIQDLEHVLALEGQ